MTTRNAAATRPAALASHVGGLLLLVVPPLDMLMPAPASTETYKALRAQCFLADADPGLKIRGCDAVIDAPRESVIVRARAYLHRGTAFAMRGDNRRAIADYDAALDLMPRNAEVRFRRGIAKLACQDSTGGNADLRAAQQIEPGIDNRLSHLRP